ncbi:FRG domain-containing protein [Acinetobacter shaoyimingii]|uniref:FRG domain-containing protein n=2 Tax=Acinetobacter shaoyimingii TaxID=2715164 RepID=A0A6G8S051_9GAMM|nr:FRG domain-containing protein [Acinetobacter shaoyimingii]
MEICEIEKLSEFIAYLEDLPRNYSLSRGQSKSYTLLPSAFRYDENGNRLFRKIDIKRFLDDFKVNSHPYITNVNFLKHDNEWMIYAQHYGIPTRLLDFTYSHIISLMFALENSFNEREPENGVIWFLDPCALNLQGTDGSSKKVLNLADNAQEIDQATTPVVVTCHKIHERINAQNGLFVYFQEENNQPLEDIANQNVLKKLVINKESKKDILKSLSSLGIGYSSIYPELSSVSKDIMLKRNIEEYLKGMEE